MAQNKTLKSHISDKESSVTEL